MRPVLIDPMDEFCKFCGVAPRTIPDSVTEHWCQDTVQLPETSDRLEFTRWQPSWWCPILNEGAWWTMGYLVKGKRVCKVYQLVHILQSCLHLGQLFLQGVGFLMTSIGGKRRKMWTAELQPSLTSPGWENHNFLSERHMLLLKESFVAIHLCPGWISMKKVCLRSFITQWGLTQQCCMQSPHERALKKHCEIRGLVFCFFFPPSLSSQILSELEPTRSRMKFSFQRGWSFKFPHFLHFTLFLRVDFLLDVPFSSSFSVEVSFSLSWKVVC